MLSLTCYDNGINIPKPMNTMVKLMVLNRVLIAGVICLLVVGCKGESPTTGNDGDDDGGSEEPTLTTSEFKMGADLSYLNQILDHGGSYQDSGSVEDPYKIFSEYGTEVARFRLWHDPEWTANLYEGSNNPIYNGLVDVNTSIQRAKAQGMEVTLDFHYSDTWADPEQQRIPDAWREVRDLGTLKDSVYKYTKQTLQHLNQQGLMPEYVQIGNETNCGLLYSNVPDGFPALNVCDDNWQNAGEVIKSGIEAVREVSANSDVDTKIILHVAQPENVQWWFDNITGAGDVSDFDIIGISYYTAWSEVPLGKISDRISNFRNRFNKDVMIVETAYPWTLENADDYNNIFGQNSLVEGYAATKKGQRDFMIKLTQEVIDGGGTGIMYWEPGWITSNMKDRWGTGSSWENNAFFNFEGKVHIGIDYLSHDYDFEDN